MERTLAGRSALVTGSTSGIGLGIALLLAEGLEPSGWLRADLGAVAAEAGADADGFADALDIGGAF